MRSPFLYIILVLISLIALSCTNPRWTLQEQSAVDPGDYKILNKEEFLSPAGKVTPDDPVLRLQLLSRTTYEYSKKVQVQRSMQKYRLRPGFLTLGLAGAALSFYIANTNAVTGNRSSAKSITLNTAGSLLALVGFLNLKPSGEPRMTGEERFLRETGTVIVTDTLQVRNAENRQADISIFYGDRKVQESNTRKINAGVLEINLSEALNALDIEGADTDNTTATIQFQDSSYHFSYHLDQILQPFARTTRPVTELRSSPEETSENILAELGKGSQMQITDGGREYGGWYTVLYGISENYILKSDAELTWHSSGFAEESQVIAVPRIPFGNIDVENNIPVLSGIDANALGIIISNENYQRPYSKRTYSHRDGRLIRSYLENALGFKKDRIFELQDISGFQPVLKQLTRIDSLATDSTELFVFISGYGKVTETASGLGLGLIPSQFVESTRIENQLIDLSLVFQRIASIPAAETIILADIDFSIHEDTSKNIASVSETPDSKPLQKLASIIIDQKETESAVLFGCQLDQASVLYLNNAREDKKHHLFPYFFARALQERKTALAEINQFLEGNIPYNARRLHDRSQDIRFFGNSSINLVDE